MTGRQGAGRGVRGRGRKEVTEMVVGSGQQESLDNIELQLCVIYSAICQVVRLSGQ